ncbi:MAG TPA: efflux RND transporter periplasmic adaptor subunit [Steroidobacteraceae bacterium]|jgi:RND family efflux transporter MFP subunit|nr:efflux RND transporter periplasmic adaptor subunit [Steroidobacteraceae bacterium]
MRYLSPFLALAITAVLISGCGRQAAAQTGAPSAPLVTVAQVISRPITEFDEFTARFEAVERVELRPRVSGYVTSIDFTQGREVKKGQVLAVIDARPYQAELKGAQAQLAEARSRLALSQSERTRAVRLLAERAISREEYDTDMANTQEAGANVDAAAAAVDTAALNLQFTRVIAPISGIVGRAEVTAGNLVTSGQTLLTTLVSIDPIYVSFDGDEQAYLQYLRLGRSPGAPNRKPVYVGLADETGYPHQGLMVFVDNEIDPATGTVRARGLLANPEREFMPGMFARVKLPGASAHEAVLINDSAVGTDQSAKYVLVVGADHRAQYRPVELGPLVDGLRVIRSGLARGDTIVVDGLQRVQPGSLVAVERIAMGEHATGDAGKRQGLVAQNGTGQ